MRFKLVIECDGAAFEDDCALEIVRILRKYAKENADRRMWPSKVPLLDVNGNVCGNAEFTPPEGRSR